MRLTKKMGDTIALLQCEKEYAFHSDEFVCMAAKKLATYEDINDDPEILADIVASRSQEEQVARMEEREKVIDEVLKIINREQNSYWYGKGKEVVEFVDRVVKTLKDSEE